jgi:putative ABC transport system permease protein
MRSAEIKESLLMAMGAIAAHKLRSALTLLGILVGVFSIIVVMTAMRVMQSNIEQELGRLGTHTFVIQKWPALFFGGRDGWEKYWRRKAITRQQVEALEERTTLPLSIGVQTGLWRGAVKTTTAETEGNVGLYAVTPPAFEALNWTIESGRPIMSADVDSARNVCVLGASVVKKLFPHSSPLGTKVKYDGINYSVVGIIEPRGTTMGGDQDNFIVVPLSTGLNRFAGRWTTLGILVRARSQELFEDTIEQTRGALRTIRKVPPGEEDDFELFTSDSLITQFRSVTFAARMGAAVISSIALLAAGIGIMNIMLVSVTERTREIGIRRAVGAKKRTIMTQFIMEAVILCQVGGIVGVILGIIAGNAAAYFLKLPPAVPLDWAVLGMVICSAVGIIFGTYPALKAANLDPIESLRYE